jgi:hypothetical protein
MYHSPKLAATLPTGAVPKTPALKPPVPTPTPNKTTAPKLPTRKIKPLPARVTQSGVSRPLLAAAPFPRHQNTNTSKQLTHKASMQLGANGSRSAPVGTGHNVASVGAHGDDGLLDSSRSYSFLLEAAVFSYVFYFRS